MCTLVQRRQIISSIITSCGENEEQSQYEINEKPPKKPWKKQIVNRSNKPNIENPTITVTEKSRCNENVGQRQDFDIKIDSLDVEPPRKKKLTISTTETTNSSVKSKSNHRSACTTKSNEWTPNLHIQSTPKRQGSSSHCVSRLDNRVNRNGT